IDQMPLWGQEVFGDSHTAASAGQAGYLSMALAGLGLPATLVSCLGDDRFGDQIAADLARMGIPLADVERLPGTPTAITVGIVRPDGERAFVSDFTPLSRFDHALVERHRAIVERARIVCFVGIFCLPSFALDTMAEIMKAARQRGQTTVLDTGWDPANWPDEHLSSVHNLLRWTELFLPNHDEARAITGIDSPSDAARALLELGPSTVVVKCGAEGSLAVTNDELIVAPAYPTEVVDAVGAGDAFDAGFLLGRLRGASLDESLRLGNATASIYVSRIESRFPCEEEVRSKMLSGTAIADTTS
ncbi:MAG: sugar kinase, partial [Thermomicrobiales bacterium]|nr:sugar kinase [Thermomicrobiales bacterium]